MTHGSLFSGIGGFDLAAEWMGWENKFHCEWDIFCQRVLKYYWPNAKSYGDIDKTDFTIWRGRIDVLSGGFPCQPYSSAGKRKGKEDDRHKWPQMLRAIREIQPGYVVGENVRGLTNWNRGLVFDEVQADLEAEGYEVLPFLLPACGINAPHKRDRIWFIAHSVGNGHKRRRPGQNRYSSGQGEGKENQRERIWHDAKRAFKKRAIANPVGVGQQGPRRSLNSMCSTKNENWKASWTYDDGGWPTQSPVCCGDDGLPGKLDNISFLDWSEGSLKGYGNAVVPQIVFKIFNVIELLNNSFTR
jgi:DNA (cytosine-5)-methyltransferase 1